MKRFDGKRLEQARLRAGMSQGDLAFAIRRASSGAIKATERGIRGWEKGPGCPRGETVNIIAEVLDCDSEHFYAASDDEDEEAAMASATLAKQADLLIDLLTRVRDAAHGETEALKKAI